MSNNYCQIAIYDRNNRNDAQLNETSNNNTNLNYSEMTSTNESIKPAIYMGDGWCTFPDLDNFDSEKLLKAFTLKEKDSADSIWDPSLSYLEPCHYSQNLSISALRQLEALFNLSQLLFGLSRAETVNYTFRDLQLRKHPHSFKKSGFKQLNSEGRIDFYSVFEKLVNDIIEAGGIEVTLLIYKNPVLPMVRQKCLDLISNVTTVPDVAFKILRQHIWFLDHLLILVRDGEIVSDKIPALSVLIRLLKVMLTERIISAYMKLVDMQYIDSLVDIFESPEYTESAELLPFFIKFEFITMQSLTVILGDAEYSQLWSDKAKTRLLNYCMIVLLKASGAYPTIVNNDQVEQINHIFYAEQHTNKHSLAHTIMTVTELLRNDENMKLFYRYHRPFKQLIIQLYKKYGAKSLYIRTDPGISYALNHLMRVLYIKNTMPSSNASSSDNASTCLDNKKQRSSKNLTTAKKNSSEIDIQTQHQPRTCSNPECKNEETKYKPFKLCSSCNGAVGYCSSRCKKSHISFHLKSECRREDLSLKNHYQPHTYNRIYSSTSTGNYQKNSQTNRRTSENLQLKNFQDNYQQSIPKRRESSAGQELFYQLSTTNTRKLSKYPSMNENQRRNSVTSNMPYQEVENMCLQQAEDISNLNRVNPVTKNFYAKRSSMKESKSGNTVKRYSAFEDSTNFKIKTTKQIMDDTANSVQFVRPLKTSTALCLPELTRHQSLKDSKSTEPDQFKKIDQIKKNSDSSYGSNVSSESNYGNCGKSISIKNFKNSTEMAIDSQKRRTEIFHTEDIMDSIIVRRIKKHEILNDNNNEENTVHKRRHSATAAILTSNANTIIGNHKAFDDSTKSKHSYPINDSLFYNQNNNQESNEFENNTKKKNYDYQHTSDDNAEKFSKSSSYLSDTEHKSDEYAQKIKIQKYKCLEEDEIEEVETKRWSQTNEPNLGCSNEGIESKVHSDLQKDTAANDLSSVSDDQDLRSTFKVVKEFEKTLQFVNNASNLKVMPSLSMNPNEEESNYKLQGLNAPQISLASLCYDSQMSNKIRNELYDENENQNNQESTSSNTSSLDDDDNEESNDSEDGDQNQAGEEPKINQMGRNLKGVNLIINNSIDSHMLTNSYMLKDPIQINDLKIMRKNDQAQKKLSYNDIKQKSIKNNLVKLGVNRMNSNNHLIQKPSNDNDKKKQIDEDEEFVDDDLSFFKENNTLNTDKSCDFVTFTKPLMYNEIKTTSNLYSTKLSVYPHHNQQKNEFQRVRQPSFELKNLTKNQVYVQKHQELKVFDNISVNITQQTNSTVSTLNPAPELPKNSTPIFTDHATAASLNAKHRQFLNAKLNLTIAPPASGQQIDFKKPNTINNTIKLESSKPVFLVPQIPPVNASNEQSLKQKNSPSHANTYKTSTLKSNSNLMMENMNYGLACNSKSGTNGLERKMTHKIMSSEILDVSKISALENATSTNSCVVVTKADIPKDIKKCLKDEIKKDKSKCSIQ